MKIDKVFVNGVDISSLVVSAGIAMSTGVAISPSRGGGFSGRNSELEIKLKGNNGLTYKEGEFLIYESETGTTVKVEVKQ